MSPTFRSLRNRNYRLYAAGSVVSNTGTWVQRIAQDWLVLLLFAGDHAAGSTALGITTGLQFLPMLLLSPYAGLVADRMSKRRLLQLTQSWMALSSGVLSLLAVTGVVEPWMVYVVALVFGVGTAFDAPARQSFVSEMVGPDDLTNAVGLNSASFNLARVTGPALSGFLIAALGNTVLATGLVIAINAVSYVAVIAALQVMRDEELVTSPRAAARGHGMVREGIGYVRGRADLMLVLTSILFIGTFGMNFQMTSALMATQVFDKGSGQYGLLGTTLAVGSLCGALLGARRVGAPRLRLVVFSGIAFGVIDIALGLMPNYVTFALLTPLLGLSMMLMLNAANTTAQLGSTPEMRGRVMALYMVLVNGGKPIGAPVIGWVGATFGARWTLIGGGMLALLGVLVAVAIFRHVQPGSVPGWRSRAAMAESSDHAMAA